MRFVATFFSCLLSFGLLAGTSGTLTTYEWRLGFKLGASEFQPTMKIEFAYEGEGDYPSELALPVDSNLGVFKLQYKVDGKKVDPVPAERVVYWSNGEKVPVLMPPPGGKKVSAEAIFTIRNLFVVPPAPTSFSIPCKKLEIGFAPISGFQFSGVFVGKAYKFERNRIPFRPGEPSFVTGFKLKGLPASEKQELIYIYPKSFQFSFNALKDQGGSDNQIDVDKEMMHNQTSIDPNLTPYAMSFYKEDPSRDWVYMTTWLQQENTYFPFGIEIGGHTATRTLFKGAGESREDLLPWQATLADPNLLAGVVTDMDAEFDGNFETIEKFRQAFSDRVKIDHTLSRLIATQKDGAYSPAMANMILATELRTRLKIYTVPAFITDHEASMLGKLPASAFSGAITGMKIKDQWYYLDAADATWTLKGSFEKIAGKNIVLLDGTNVRATSY